MKNSITLFLCIILILFSSVIVFSQDSPEKNNKWIKWGKADFSYTMKNNFEHRDYSFNEENPGRFLLKTLINTYWFFISDEDGDNCSFSPTCSNFFLQSVKMTNIAQGSLMFFDRFTRDMNIFGKRKHYPYSSDGYFYDPPSLYTLNKNKINYIPSSVVVKNE